MHNAQFKSALIVQQARNFHQIQPDWYPSQRPLEMEPQVAAVFTGTDWDEKIDRDGWVFLKKGDAYAAVRVVLWDQAYEDEHSKKGSGNQVGFNSYDSDATVKLSTTAYQWSKDKEFIELQAPYSPVIIQAGRKAQYQSFENFMTSILGNPIALYKTVSPGCNILVYSPYGADKEEMVFNAANDDIPMIDGKYIDYSYPMTFDSPYLKSAYKSGKVELQFGDEHLSLDFTEKASSKEPKDN